MSWRGIDTGDGPASLEAVSSALGRASAEGLGVPFGFLGFTIWRDSHNSRAWRLVTTQSLGIVSRGMGKRKIN